MRLTMLRSMVPPNMVQLESLPPAFFGVPVLPPLPDQAATTTREENTTTVARPAAQRRRAGYSFMASFLNCPLSVVRGPLFFATNNGPRTTDQVISCWE